MTVASRYLRLTLGLCGTLAPLLPTLPAQNVRLLKQIFPRTGPNPGSTPRDFVAMGAHVYSGSDGYLVRYDPSGNDARRLWPDSPTELVAAGRQLFFLSSFPALWRSDGTVSGTTILAPINPAYGQPASLTPLGSKVVFVAQSGAGREPWISDGTSAGTIPLADIRPGPGNSSPRALTARGRDVYFLADDGLSGEELWRTDGTSAGTVLVADTRPGAASGGIQHLVADGGPRLWFFASDGRGGNDLWRSDGTTAGTVRVAPAIPNASLHPYGNGAIYLQVRNNRTELWTSDGSAAGTRRVLDVGPASTRTTAIRPYVAGGLAYFAVPNAIGDGELWRTDGTAAGTIALTSQGHLPRGAVLASLGVRVYFAAGTGDPRGIELWSSDGSIAGTLRLRDIHPTGSANPSNLVAIGNRIWMGADDGRHGVEPWVTDGTPGGTRLVDNVATWGAANETLRLVTSVDDQAWFVLDRGTTADLWRSDGTAAGTSSVQIPWTNNRFLGTVMVGAGRTFFAAAQPTNPQSLTDLWITDGTQAGTRLFRAGIGWCRDMVDLGETAVFGAGLYGQDLWVTDGTPAGTRSLGSQLSYLRVTTRFVRIGNRAWFMNSQDRLSVTDGTVAGTTVVAATAGHQMRSEPIRLGDRIVFAKANELVFTDGTAAGTSTVPIATVVSSGPVSFEANSRGVFLLTSSLLTGSELWFSDGTVAGTQRLGFERQFYMTGGRVWRDRFYFAWTSAAAGAEPWVSDGTPRGTHILRDIEPGPGSSYSGPPIGVGSRYLYFNAAQDLQAPVWRSDGTPAGTRPLAGPPLRPLAHAGGRLLCMGRDPWLGNQLYAIDLFANTKVVGHGCASGLRVPRLSAADPVLGGQTQLDLASPHATQAAVALFGLPTSIDRYTRLRGGCVIVPDLTLPTLAVATRTDASGNARLTLPIPRIPVLIGARLYVQAAVGATSTGPLGTDLTPGVSLTLGQ